MFGAFFHLVSLESLYVSTDSKRHATRSEKSKCLILPLIFWCPREGAGVSSACEHAYLASTLAHSALGTTMTMGRATTMRMRMTKA